MASILDCVEINWVEMGVPVQLGDQLVVVDKIFIKDFPRLDPVVRNLSIAEESVVRWPLETVVDRLFNEVVRRDEALLLRVTEEACQSGAATLLTLMVEAYQRKYGEPPCIQDLITKTDISRKEDQVFVKIDIKGKEIKGSQDLRFDVEKVLHKNTELTL